MAIFSRIDVQNGRIYQIVQALLATGLLLAGAGYLIGERSSAVGWALALCILAIASGIFALAYLRRSLTLRLREAAVAEAARTRLMQTDSLTDVMTRRHFLDEMSLALGSVLKPNRLTLLLVDLDHFKQLNDGFGHGFGDAALVHLADCLEEAFPGASIGRLGGDEFAIALADGPPEAALSRANHLINLLRDGIQHEGNTVPLSVSIGLAIAPQHGDTPKELIASADIALYRSKADGRGRVTAFEPTLVTDIRHRRYLERELRAAIYMNELEMHYQPIVDASGEVKGAEGLVRWRHPLRGLVSPAEFIPVAERSTLIDQVGAWVFRRACLDFDAVGCGLLSINVSGEQLKRDELVHMLQLTLAETGRHASQFVLEITETAAMAGTEEVLARLRKLRDMGFRIALDDFGTGHCGFNYLQKLPIDAIKIDRSYIRDLVSNDIATVFVSALVEIARMRSLTVVAEGVETELELQLATAAGCTRFQGYLLGRPAAVRPPFAMLHMAGA